MYKNTKEASAVLGVHPNTLRKLANNNKIKTIKISNQRRYNVDKYLQTNKNYNKNSNLHKICYCRVSSMKQKEDLNRQIKFLKEKYPNYKVVYDIASGLNDNRKGLKYILQLSNQKLLAELIIVHKDRLSRFGFGLIKYVIELNGGKIIVVNKSDDLGDDLTKDIIAIMTVFAAKIHGSRKYKSLDK